MGFYLSKPVTDKVSSSHENDFLKCGASSMQGWRMSQEDAHNCCLDFDSEISLFAVYDGHGGAEVAEYASRHLPTTIKEMEAYKSGDFETALKEAFLSFDSTLVTQPVIDELKEIAGQKGKKEEETEDEASEEDDISGLREEASMPLSDVIARYANGTIPKTPALKRLAGESTKSPYLRARSSKSSDGEEVSSSSICPSGSGSSSKVNGEAETSTSSKKEGSEAAVECSEATCTPNGELQPTTNGKTSEPSPEEPDSAKKSENCEVSSSSSSVVNGESPTSSSKYSKRDRSKAYKSILAAVASALDDESDESDDNDESFNANPDTSINSSSDEELDEDGEGEDEEDSEEEEDEEEDDEEVDLTNEETEEEPGKDSGCTAVVSLVTKDRVIVANAGDSRAVLSRRGVAVDLSFDHKPEDPPEMERITNAGGKVTSDGRVNGGLNLSRALGDHMYKKSAGLSATEQMITALPDIKSVDIGPEEDEFIVLACDGIWNSMSSQQVVDFIRPEIIKGEKLSAICEKLFDNCLAENTFGDGTGCDNMTCIIVRLFPDKELGPADTEASKNEGEGDETMEEGAEAEAPAGTKRKSEESDQDGSKRQKVSEDAPDSSESKSSDSQT